MKREESTSRPWCTSAMVALVKSSVSGINTIHLHVFPLSLGY